MPWNPAFQAAVNCDVRCGPARPQLMPATVPARAPSDSQVYFDEAELMKKLLITSTAAVMLSMA
ncbi:hypothetical protein, partial [Pseudomonas sp. DE0010]|uniref:hypothetical protein n=1 Tax=Pseudomonas sp. DE0010 TaxID=2584951 RepID=UPI001C4994E8